MYILCFPADVNGDPVNQMTDLEELNEEEMLMRAIAMSLEEEKEEVSEEELGSIKIQVSFYRKH